MGENKLWSPCPNTTVVTADSMWLGAGKGAGRTQIRDSLIKKRQGQQPSFGAC